MIKDRFSKHMQAYLGDDRWLVLQERDSPEENLKYESLFALSNGYLGTRGSYEEGAQASIPCTYVNGVFDKSETFMRELANLPNWLGLKLYLEKQLLGVETCQVFAFSRVLDMGHGLLARRAVFQDKKGRKTLVEGLRMASRANVHRMGIYFQVTPLNYSGVIEVENIIDGSVVNFSDAPRFKVKHTKLVENCPLGQKGAYLEVATRDWGLHVGIGSLVEAYDQGRPVMKNRHYGAFGETGVEFQDFYAREGEMVEVVKYVAIYTQRELSWQAIHGKVKEEAEQFAAEGFGAQRKAHQAVYQQMWQKADIQVQGDDDLDRAIRFNLFHLMSAGNQRDGRVNIGAKLLSGQEYGGHAFWDTELFMLPFFAFLFPAAARNLVDYRYHLLEAARENARKHGYQGAQYPWESADDGAEQCPDWTIEPDGTCDRCYVAVYEHHVTAAVAYGIYHYARITGDLDFLYQKGARVLAETARFWASRCQYNQKQDRYEILKVTGPDEWHEPVDNNLYTNYMARWNLGYGADLLEEMKEGCQEAYEALKKDLALEDQEVEAWREKKEKIYLPKGQEIPGEEGRSGLVFPQFQGYFDLKDVTVQSYDENDWPIRPKLLETTAVAETQMIKQADVAMLFHLFGQEFSLEEARENYAYYEKRTLHGSSLSPSIYAMAGLKAGIDAKAYRYLRRAAFLDLLDIQGNTREGIHAANAGGVWQTVVFGFAGMSLDGQGILCFSPHMPKEWESLSFSICRQGALLKVSIQRDNQVAISLAEGKGPVKVKVQGETRVLKGVWDE